MRTGRPVTRLRRSRLFYPRGRNCPSRRALPDACLILPGKATRSLDDTRLRPLSRLRRLRSPLPSYSAVGAVMASGSSLARPHGTSPARPSLLSQQTQASEGSGSTSSGSTRTSSHGPAPSPQDLAEVEDFLTACVRQSGRGHGAETHSYRDGELTPDRIPEKPRALHPGGRISRWVADKDLAQ